MAPIMFGRYNRAPNVMLAREIPLPRTQRPVSPDPSASGELHIGQTGRSFASQLPQEDQATRPHILRSLASRTAKWQTSGH